LLNRQPFDIHAFKSEFFKALAHPIRIELLELLSEKDQFVHELTDNMNAINSALISQHLSILRAKNIVQGKREGNKVKYSLTDPKLAELLAIAREIFNNQLSDTITLLTDMDTKDEKK